MMCLFHDLPEARIGDLNYVNKKYVQANEEKAIADATEAIRKNPQLSRESSARLRQKRTVWPCLPCPEPL